MTIINLAEWKNKKDEEELYNKVVAFAESWEQISISAIQKEFHLGYNHAAAIMKRMEEAGLVGPPASLK